MPKGNIYNQKSDIDNITKIVLDALNGIAYRDDSQVCRICFTKTYSENSRLKILIIKVGENLDNNNQYI